MGALAGAERALERFAHRNEMVGATRTDDDLGHAVLSDQPRQRGGGHRDPSLAGEPVARLLELLKEPEDRVRYRAKVELSARDPKEVATALGTWSGPK